MCVGVGGESVETEPVINQSDSGEQNNTRFLQLRDVKLQFPSNNLFEMLYD